MMQPTVLVVDDDDDIRALVQLTLELTTNWRMITANDGATAIDVARTQRPDAILMDMMMPGMNGLEAFELLQGVKETQDTPVVLLTAKIHVAGQAPWDGYAIHGTIAKPFDPMTLAQEVTRLLSWPSAK